MLKSYGPPRSRKSSMDTRIIPVLIVIVLVFMIFVVAFFSIFLFPFLTTDKTISRPVHDPLTQKNNIPRIIEGRGLNLTCPNGFHAQTPLGSDQPSCITRMPYPRAVDEELFDKKLSPCDSFAAYACGNFAGLRGDVDSIVDIAFGTAQRGAQRMFDAVVQMDAKQVEKSAKTPPTERAPNGVMHDFVLSCVYSSARPDTDDDLTFTHDTMAMFDLDSMHSNESDAFASGWGVGVGVGLGDESAFAVTTSMNPAANRETVIYVGGGTQLRMLPMIPGSQMRMAMETACTILIATGQFPFEKWTTALECAEDSYRIYYSLARNFIESSDEASNLDYEYFRTGIQDDLFSVNEMGDLIGSRDFYRGLLAGLRSVLMLSIDMLTDNGLGLPDLESLRTWMMFDTFGKFVVQKAHDVGLLKWKTYLRVMVIVNDYQYSDALLNVGREGQLMLRGVAHTPVKIERPTVGLFGLKNGKFNHHVFGLGHNPSHHGVESAPRVEVSENEKSESFLRDEWIDESQLINSEMFERCAYLAAMHLPELTDNMFARMAVSPERREAAESMTKQMIDAVAGDIQQSVTLSEAAKKTLVASVKMIEPRVATPWHDEPPPSLPYTVDPNASMLRNAKRIRMRNIAQDTMEALLYNGQPANKRRSMAHHFDMASSAVNAYFDPSRPSIAVLPGILTPPFFSEKYSSVSQAARFGALVGHELTHRTDANSKYFDAEGNLGRDWLPPEMTKRYEQVEQCYVEQYDSYTTPLGNKIDGKQTLGENMADTMGARAALRALESMLGREATREELKEFALSYAQMWCSAPTAEEEADRARDDPHAPAAARIDGVLRNLETPSGKHVMKEVFNCPPESAMTPKKICKVW